MTVPAHVPPELVVDVDIYNIPNIPDSDPQQAWRIFKGRGPLVFSPYNGGHWIATNSADIFEFYRDAARFSSRQIVVPDHPGAPLLPIMADPPDHSEYRRNVMTIFTQAAVDEISDDIRELAIAMIEDVKPNGGCNFVTDFGLQLPLIVFLRMVNLPPEDRLFLRRLIETYSSDPDMEAKKAVSIELRDYLEGWIRKRMESPGDDIISHVIQSKKDGRPYTHEEVVGTTTLLFHAGLDTVANTLGFMALHLAGHPEDRDFIRCNPDKMHDIIQELLRRCTVANQSRVVAQDTSHKGVLLKKGDRVTLPGSLFNLDGDVAPDPDRVDFSRSCPHITFGAGPHSCAGARLARREIAIFLEEWLARIPDFEVDDTRPLRMHAGLTNQVEELWLRWPVS